MPCALASPEELQAELDLARRGGSSGDDAGGGRGRAGGGGVDDGIGRIEIGVIEEIEDFGAELERETFRDGKFAGDGEVGFDKAGALQGVAADVAVGAGQRLDEGIGIEELRGAALDDGA